MHEVGLYVVEQALVVRYQHECTLRSPQAVNAIGDDFQRIDVESRVGLVEYPQHRFKYRHLENLVALLFTAGKALVDAPVEKALVHLHQLRFLPDQTKKLRRIDLGFAVRLAAGIEGRAQQIDIADAGDFNRILKAEEKPGPGAFLRCHVEQVLVTEDHRTGGDRIALAARQYMGERALARAVWSHDGVNFAGPYHEVHASQDFPPGDGDPQVVDGQ